jgi:hypothetical protein
MRSLAVLFALALLAAPGVASAQVSDTTPPTLVSVGFSPSPVDVSAGPQTVTVSLGITDDLSGVSFEYLNYGQRVGIVFRSPSGAQTQVAYEYQFTQVPGGDLLSGTWNADVTFPLGAESGNWLVESITLEDVVGNKVTFDTSVLQDMGFPTTLTVISDTDSTPPVLVAFSIDPTIPVDTSAGSAELKVTMHLTDDKSGVDFSGPNASFTFGVLSPTGNFIRGCNQPVLMAGTPQDGTWESSCWFPQYSQVGTWGFWGPQLWDAAGNSYWVQAADLDAIGAPTGIDLISDPSDTAVPQISAFSFAPTFIDTSGASQTVIATASATDDLSGFGAVQVNFVSPSGAQQRLAYVYNLVSGDQTNGVFDGQALFPQFSEAGTWKVQSLFYYDAVFNYKFLNTDEITALGWPTVLNVVKASLESDGTVGPDGGTVTDTVFGDRASLTLPPGAVTQPTEVAIDVLESPLTFPMPDGFSAPGSYFVNISFTPEPAMPFPAPGATVVLPLVNPMIPGTSLTLYSVDPATGTLVASISVFGGPVVGAVDPGGLSATFAGVAHFSVVVALFTDHEPPVVTPPADITVTETEPGGARGSASADLANLLAGGSATDNVDVSPTRLSPQVGAVDVDNSTLFPIGTTTVTFRYKDTAGNTGTATAKVTVTSGNHPPEANAGPDQTVTMGSTVQLNGAGATDVDGDPLTYAWSFVSKPAGSVATLANPATVNPTFVADKPGSYVVQLIVRDGLVNSAPDTVTVTVMQASPVLRARAAGRQVQLTWTDVGAAGYAVYRGTTAGGPYVKIAEVPGTQLMYLDGDRSVGATYYWVVRAIAASGDPSAPSNEVMAKIAGR